MDRAGQLLDRLVGLFHNGAGRDELLQALQQLQAEVAGHPSAVALSAATKSGKISVILPAQPALATVQEPTAAVPEEEKIIQVLQVDERELEAELEEMKKSADLKNELSLKVRQATVEWQDPLDDIPTLASHREYLPKANQMPADPHEPVGKGSVPGKPPAAPETGKDLNDLIGRSDASLNERLRTAQSELSEKLQDTPLKDLRKAIGINDRYLYINELFNGNEAMFDRSLKTLNAFSIYAEAEFWMQRELRIKLGWKEENVLVQQFIQLVRRRFS
jgi:hypothetical protein